MTEISAGIRIFFRSSEKKTLPPVDSGNLAAAATEGRCGKDADTWPAVGIWDAPRQEQSWIKGKKSYDQEKKVMDGYGHAGPLQSVPIRHITCPGRPRPTPAAYRPSRSPGGAHCGRTIA